MQDRRRQVYRALGAFFLTSGRIELEPLLVPPDDSDRLRKGGPRRHVMAAFASSLGEFDGLYRELAK